MTLLSRFLAEPARAGIETPAVPMTDVTLLDALESGSQSHAGVRVSEETALGVPAVWRAVTLISGVAASLPLHAYRSDGNSRRKLSSGAAADLLADPHPDMTDFELWELAYGSLALWGNSYHLKLRFRGDPTSMVRELSPLAPWRVRVARALDDTKVYVIDGDLDNPLTDAQVLHIPGYGYDGVCGVSPIRAHRHGLGLALAAEEYGARLFAGGSLASGILQTEQRLDDTQARQLKMRWREQGGRGLESAHDVRVLGSGAKFQQLTIPPEDAQFLGSRQFQLSEVGRMFGVPPVLLFDMERSTSWGTGVEQQMLAWVKFGLQPSWLTRVERRLTKLLRPQAVYAKYSLEGLLRGDSAARAAFYNSLWQLGVLSTNEIRELEDRDPVEGGDVRYRPLNMGELGQPDPAPALPAAPATTEGEQADA